MEQFPKVENLNEKQFRALLDPIRLRIASCLKTPLSPKQVAEKLNIRPNNLYHHFKVLKKANIITHVETKQGKGFIKEDFYRLNLDESFPHLGIVTESEKHQLMFSLFQALEDDFLNITHRYEQAFALGIREDFCLHMKDLDAMLKMIVRERKALMDELNELTEPDSPPSYQLSIFGFRI